MSHCDECVPVLCGSYASDAADTLTLVLTALQIVLGRWAGEEDVLIGLKVPTTTPSHAPGWPRHMHARERG